jgi:hypothetical protein
MLKDIIKAMENAMRKIEERLNEKPSLAFAAVTNLDCLLA